MDFHNNDTSAHSNEDEVGNESRLIGTKSQRSLRDSETNYGGGGDGGTMSLNYSGDSGLEKIPL